MPEMKNALMEQRIEQFCKSSEELLTGLHARKKTGDKNSLNKKRRMQDTFSIADMDHDFHADDNLDGLL